MGEVVYLWKVKLCGNCKYQSEDYIVKCTNCMNHSNFKLDKSKLKGKDFIYYE